jgi:hypothetical protein
MSEFLVFDEEGEWVVASEMRSVARYPDRVKAIMAAIDLANADGEKGIGSKVLLREDASTPAPIWTYGVDLYPSAPGKPADGKSSGGYRAS